MLILTNARVYTMDPRQPDATTIAIDRGEILAVGDESSIFSDLSISPKRATSRKHQYINLGGRVVLPGLTDAHIHLEQYSLSLNKVDCETPSKEQCLRQVAERVRVTPKGEWILGHGWNQNSWIEGFGTVEELDALSTEHPIYLTAKSLHAGWANSNALRLANITKSTLDPNGGRIGRDLGGGPNGIVFESAMELISSKIPNPTHNQLMKAISAAQKVLWKMGITGVHDFDRQRCFSALQDLHTDQELRIRVIKSIPLADLPHAIALGLRTGFGDDILRIGSVKAFADGALGPRTAAMLQAYNQEPENLGMLLLDAEDLFEHGRQAVENGLSLAVHAIGDRANHEVLNAYENLIRFENNQIEKSDRPLSEAEGQRHRRLRHRIEHVQLIHPNDADRLGKLGIIASMQPIHAPSDMLMADQYWGERAALSYAWQTQLEHGAMLVFGSDAPVESPNPFWGLHAAITRRRADGNPGMEGWIPDQRLSLQQALQAYTTGPAYASYMENRLGKISQGYLADLIVLNQNPFACAPDEIRAISPTATMIAGEWVFNEI